MMKRWKPTIDGVEYGRASALKSRLRRAWFWQSVKSFLCEMIAVLGLAFGGLIFWAWLLGV